LKSPQKYPDILFLQSMPGDWRIHGTREGEILAPRRRDQDHRVMDRFIFKPGLLAAGVLFIIEHSADKAY
jgi:hypothetical protein